MELRDKDRKHELKSMTDGSPIKLIFAFAVPMLIGNIFQQLYNMVDSVVVGNYVGKVALAAVGTGFPIIFMMSSMFIGIALGATILISQFYGAGDIKNVKKTAQTIYTAMLIGSVPLSILGILLSGIILNLTNVPSDAFPMAKLYMVIVFAGLIGSLGFNVNTGILQGLGDSKSSLLFLAIACVINIVLDLLFVLSFRLGVAGVAYATITSQIFSWIFGIIYMRKKYDFLDISIIKLKFDKIIFMKILKLGIPSGIQQALFSIGIMSLQSLVNSYGSDYMAGFNAANKIDTFAFMPIQSFANAVTTYVGQNIGAGRMERVHKGMVSTALVSMIFCIIIGSLTIPLGPAMLKMFNPDPLVVESGMYYLKSVVPFFALLALDFTLSSVVRGAGETIVPMVATIVSLWAGRVPAAYILAHYFGKEYIFYSYLIGWVLWFAIIVPYYLSGRWKSKFNKLISS
nr:MATE family efflux transporter [Sedimentibacter sp.]